MLQIDRNGLGLNQITFQSDLSEEAETETVTVYGNGIIDKIALATLNLLGNFFKDLKPIRFKVSYNHKDRYFFPHDMFITRKALRTLLTAKVRAWSAKENVELTEATRNKVLDKVIDNGTKSLNDGILFQECLNNMQFKLNSELKNRVIALELFLSEKLSQIESDTCEFSLPVDQRTGNVVTRKDKNRKDSYNARIKIKYDETEGRKALFLEDKNGKKADFSNEALHVLSKAIGKLKDYAAEPLTMKQIAKKLEDDAFSEQYFELGEIPIVDESEHTKVFLNPEGTAIKEYNIANHINLNGKKYIATMYPLHDELWKYWEMIHEQECPVIVKLNDIKKGTEKHDPSYWPSTEQFLDFSEDGLNLRVENKNETKITEYLVKRELEVTKNGRTHTVIQIDFLGWPDKTTPKTSQFLRMLKFVNEAYDEALKNLSNKNSVKKVSEPDAQKSAEVKMEENNGEHATIETKLSSEGSADEDAEGPKKEDDKVKMAAKEEVADTIDQKKILGSASKEAAIELKTLDSTTTKKHDRRQIGPIAVHCAAGIGRTGTFLGIHSTLEQKSPDFIKLLYNMRKQRSGNMVETVEQFHFMKHIHDEYFKNVQ